MVLVGKEGFLTGPSNFRLSKSKLIYKDKSNSGPHLGSEFLRVLTLIAEGPRDSVLKNTGMQVLLRQKLAKLEGPLVKTPKYYVSIK